MKINKLTAFDQSAGVYHHLKNYEKSYTKHKSSKASVMVGAFTRYTKVSLLERDEITRSRLGERDVQKIVRTALQPTLWNSPPLMSLPMFSLDEPFTTSRFARASQTRCGFRIDSTLKNLKGLRSSIHFEYAQNINIVRYRS